MKYLLVFCISVVLALPSPQAPAEPCKSSNCLLENGCACASSESPLGNASDTPQFVVITVDDSVNTADINSYWSKLLFNRQNADGSPISATFLVPHEYTNYTEVNALYNRGFDIGVNSITKGSADYFVKADVDTLTKEFGGQKDIISTYANIPKEDIKAVRTPHFALAGNNSIEAYQESELEIDNSWTTSYEKPLYPYTLDYRSTQDCQIGRCPTASYPGFWVHPIINLKGDNGYPCNVLFSCIIEGDSEEDILNWLVAQFERHYQKSKAPQTFLINSAWFKLKKNSLQGFSLFLDYLKDLPDTFVVSHNEVDRWVRDPIPLESYQPSTTKRNANCSSRTCRLPHGSQERLMGSCVECPTEYPWI